MTERYVRMVLGKSIKYTMSGVKWVSSLLHLRLRSTSSLM